MAVLTRPRLVCVPPRAHHAANVLLFGVGLQFELGVPLLQFTDINIQIGVAARPDSPRQGAVLV